MRTPSATRRPPSPREKASFKATRSAPWSPLGKFLLDLIVQAILVDKPLSEVCLSTNALAIPEPAAQEILKQSGIEERVEHIRTIARDLLAQPPQSSDDSDPPQEPSVGAIPRQRKNGTEAQGQNSTEEQAEHFDPSQPLSVDYLDDLVRLGPPPSLMVLAKIICEVYKCFGQHINADKSFLHLQETLADRDVPAYFSALGIAIRRPSGDSDDAHGFELLGSVVGNKRYKARWLNGFANNLLSKATLLDALGSVDPQSAFLLLTKSFVHKGRPLKGLSKQTPPANLPPSSTRYTRPSLHAPQASSTSWTQVKHKTPARP